MNNTEGFYESNERSLMSIYYIFMDHTVSQINVSLSALTSKQIIKRYP